MADTQPVPASTMNTPLAEVSRQPGSGPSHADQTRPADAGHVWGRPSEDVTNGLPGGVVVARADKSGEVKPITKAEMDAARKDFAENHPVDLVSNVGTPNVPDGTQSSAGDPTLPGGDGADGNNSGGAQGG